jgi:aryl sulfotransferase
MQSRLPRTYQSYIQDSTRWASFVPRDDDIIISTPVKSGTTWTQEIVLHLVFLDKEVPYREEVSPWLDMCIRPLDEVLGLLENQRHRRFIKTHLPLDGLPFYPQVKYIAVGRDPRDVFMSWWNHYTGFTPAHIEMINSNPDRRGAPMSPAPTDIHAHWRYWISKSGDDLQPEEYQPTLGALRHFQGWWEARHLPNILLVHYADLLANTPAQIRRIADFLEVAATDEQIKQIALQTSLTAMRTRAEEKDARMARAWKDGARTFFYKGSNGRWRDVLTAEEVAMYEAAAAKVLTPECRAWLERE